MKLRTNLKFVEEGYLAVKINDWESVDAGSITGSARA